MSGIESSKLISIVIVEDDPLVQMGLQQVLENDPLLTIVGMTKTADSGLATIKKYSPDIVLLDIGLPDKSGIKILPQISSEIIILTGHTNPEKVNLALSLGAKGYCVKGIDIAPLLKAIRLVAGGDTYIDPQIAELIQLDQKKYPSKYNLTNRECEVLELVAKAKTNAEIATKLNLSPNTVKRYVKEIAVKLGAKNRTDLAVQSWKSGLVE